MTLAEKARSYVEFFTSVRPNRRTGSAGNREATRFFADTIAQWGCEVDAAPFASVDYRAGESWVAAGGRRIGLHTGPYSLPVSTSAPLICVSSVPELERIDAGGAVLLLRGEICAEQLMPKNFVFYNPDHHRRIYELVERAAPAAVIAATGRSPEQVGALHPYPLFVDGDFDIPNAFCTEETGAAIETAVGAGAPAGGGPVAGSGSAGDGARTVRISIDGAREPSTASNVIATLGARRPGDSGRIVVTAHIDAYEDTPGALDNASGTATLLLVAELLSGFTGSMSVQIAAWNGEDHYSAGGQMDYLARYGTQIEQVGLAVNIDDIGYVQGKTAFSFYGCPPDVEGRARRVLGRFAGLQEGEPWWSGDHMIFVQAGRPAVALTADRIAEVMATVTHTGRDTPDLVDPARLAQAAEAVAALVREIAS